MKKIFITLTVALVGLNATAQQNDEYQLPDGLLATEIQFNPFSNDFKTFKMAQLKARLFLDARNVIRFGVGLGIDNDKSDKNDVEDSRPVDQDNYTIKRTEETTKNKRSEFKISLGYENHFANTGRLDFYAGAEAGYEGRNREPQRNVQLRIERHWRARGEQFGDNESDRVREDAARRQ